MESGALDKDADPKEFNKMHVFHYAKHKAGMHTRSEEQLHSMMKDMKVSNRHYYKVKEKKVQETDDKIQKMLEKIQSRKSNPTLWNKQLQECLRRFEVYKEECYLDRTWFHIDMDMFYAACELRERPDLQDKPVAVGDYSMIQTTNYIARKWGVRSAMPGFMGKQLCPQLVFIKSDKVKYKRISEEEFIPILKQYDSKLESIGLDEANLDVTDYLRENGLDCPEGRIFLG